MMRLVALAAVALLVVACGEESAPAEPTPAPTAAPGELSVGQLVARVEEAWTQVTSLRVTSTSGPIPTDEAGGTPPPGTLTTIEEAVAPDSRRIVRMTDGVTTDEQVWIDGTIYMWGTLVASAIAPEVGPTTWVTVDPAGVAPNTPLANQLDYLTRPMDNPFGQVSDELRAQPAREAGTVEVEGRTCTLYTFSDATESGSRIEYELALDERNLPCQLVQRAEGFQNSNVFEVNPPDLTIVAPDAATPASATPEG